MRNDLTEIVFILDRSGSMHPLVNDTIGGYNSFVQKQRETDGEANLTTVLFNGVCEVLHDRVDIKDVQPLTTDDYFARGGTAMLDAVGGTINDIGNKIRKMDEADRPSKVIVIITTDGMENASKEFTKQQVKDMITHQTEKYGWEFIFLGANIDAAGEAGGLGIRGANSSGYTASAIGTKTMYSTIADTVRGYRVTGHIASDWSSGLEAKE